MPQFIQALVAMAMSISTSFTHGGKPATLPPVNQQDASVHGSAVSGVATNLDPQNQNRQGSSNANTNASFGQGIAISQPDSAKTDGQAFGQSTAVSTRSNIRRP